MRCVQRRACPRPLHLNLFPTSTPPLINYLWRQGEIRPTHARRARAARGWRTRPDPFEGVWCEVLSWLQHQPDATAAELMDRLILRYPERYSRGQLRTLQRRLSQWRGVMPSS